MLQLQGRFINAFAFSTSFVMEFKSLASSFLVCLLLLLACTQAVGSNALFCHKLNIADMAALQKDHCSCDEEDRASRVLQINGRNIDSALSLYQKGSHEYAAVLFYAEWCPFSRIMRKKFDSLSASFPTIYHIAVESSRLWPSELSQHGVHSLPTLFVHNKTQKVQFQGPCLLEMIAQCYMAITGHTPISLSYLLTEGDTLLKNQQSKKMSWQKWFQAWLYEDLYLAFAVVFLTLRLLFYLQPKIVTSLRQYWSLKETSWKPQRGLLRQVNAEQRHATSRFARKNEARHLKKEEAGKGVLSVPGWPSSSLAAVALAECSSRGEGMEDAHEKIHLWG